MYITWIILTFNNIIIYICILYNVLSVNATKFTHIYVVLMSRWSLGYFSHGPPYKIGQREAWLWDKWNSNYRRFEQEENNIVGKQDAFLFVSFVVALLGGVSADITGTNPAAGSCLCYSGDSVNIRDSGETVELFLSRFRETLKNWVSTISHTQSCPRVTFLEPDPAKRWPDPTCGLLTKSLNPTRGPILPPYV